MEAGTYRRLALLVGIGVIAAAGAVLAPERATSRAPVANNVLRHALDVELGRAQPRAHEMSLSSGVLYPLLDRTGILRDRAVSVGYRGDRIEVTQ
jgi:hypothetical protein